MKYFEFSFHISPFIGDAADILSSLLADEGFEAFETADNVLHAWIQQQFFSAEGLSSAIEAMPFPDIKITYEQTEAPDENWNKLWEEYGFRPIIIYDDTLERTVPQNALIAIHDTSHTDVPQATFDICIQPCQAFGTGSHETTRMILRQLLTLPMQGRCVIDAGTGTGILAIFCRMLGADHILAYDIDEWSVRNARENISLNGICGGIEVLLGDSSVLSASSLGSTDSPAAAPRASLLIANINRNILLADMPAFVGCIQDGGEMLLSGFYVSDIPMLLETAEKLGFSLSCQSEDNGWAMLLLKKEKHPAE